VPTRPGVVRAAPTLTSISWIRLPSASPSRCDGPATKVSHLHSTSDASWRTWPSAQSIPQKLFNPAPSLESSVSSWFDTRARTRSALLTSLWGLPPMSCSRSQHTRTAPVLARALRLPTRFRRPVVRAGSNHEQSHRSAPAQTTRHAATAARQSRLTYGSPPNIRAAVTTAGERSTNDTRHQACG
jgi:hypothetical protein